MYGFSLPAETKVWTGFRIVPYTVLYSWLEDKRRLVTIRVFTGAGRSSVLHSRCCLLRRAPAGKASQVSGQPNYLISRLVRSWRR